MAMVALVTLLMVAQLMYFMGKVGAARVKHDIKAPAMSGHEEFDRNNRVHQNTIEQLMMMLPSMWLCALYLSPTLAAVLGAIFVIGRFLYGAKYVVDPESRGLGMMIGSLPILVAFLAALWGVCSELFF